jgi:hypothetical protein
MTLRVSNLGYAVNQSCKLNFKRRVSFMRDVKKFISMLNSANTEKFTAAYTAYVNIIHGDLSQAGREAALNSLNRVGRVWYVVAGLCAQLQTNKLQFNVLKVPLSGVRVLCAVAVRGVNHLVAVDVTIDANNGVVVAQWITREPVSAQNVPVLLTGGHEIFKERELRGEFFDSFSRINAITGSVRRTPDAMVRAVTTRFFEKLSQM